MRTQKLASQVYKGSVCKSEFEIQPLNSNTKENKMFCGTLETAIAKLVDVYDSGWACLQVHAWVIGSLNADGGIWSKKTKSYPVES